MSDSLSILARINHSCIPNLRHYSSVESGDKKDVRMTIKAARDILPGEQVRSPMDFLICALYLQLLCNKFGISIFILNLVCFGIKYDCALIFR